MFFLGYQLELLHDKSALKKNTYKNTRSDFASECFKAKKKHHLEETEPLLWNENYLQFCNDIQKFQVQEVISNPFQRSGEGPQRFSLVHDPPHLSQILLYVSQFRGWDIWFLGQEENKRNMIIQSLFHYHHSQRRIPPSNRSILDFCGVKLGQQIGWQKLRHQQGWTGFHGKGRVFQAKEKENAWNERRGPGLRAEVSGLPVFPWSSWFLFLPEYSWPAGIMVAFLVPFN